MNENKNNLNSTWIDEDEAPELSNDFFDNATPLIADKPVPKAVFSAAVEKAKGRPKLKNPKLLVSMRYDADIIEYFKATGKGWQSRVNEVLSQYVASH